MYSSPTYSITKQYVGTVGVSFVIDPALDAGGVHKEVAGMEGLYNTYDNYDYTPTSFFYTMKMYTHTCIINNVSYQGQGYVYTITPQKTGVSNFRIVVDFLRNNAYERYDITYSIIAVDVTNITINPSEKTMTIGESVTLTSTITHASAQTTLKWSSSNTSVATVDKNGKVIAVGVGTSVIKCTATNGVYGECQITVNPILVTNISMNETECVLNVGEKIQLSTSVEPNNATIKDVVWSSSHEAVAVVSEKGLVTAVGSGTCQIWATTSDGSGKKASCLVTVEKNNKLTVTNMTQCSGGRGVLNVLLTDEETIMGFQFDLQLPIGVSVAEDKSGKLLAALTGNAMNTHSISSSKVSEGLYRFVVTPQNNRAISNASGDGMTITVDVADNVVAGVYEMTIKDVEMTVKKAGNVYEDIHPKNSMAKLTVIEAQMGDVNGDGRVSVTDVISMNSYILEEEPAQFIHKVADLNGDGKVTITDIVKVIDIILGK